MSSMRFKKYQLNIESKTDILQPFAEDTKIPKILHQTFNSRLLPEAILENIEKIKSMNPDWEYRFYDDAGISDFIRNNYDIHILDYFNRINPIYGAAKADLFRYLLMYKCGGVYIDIKSSLRKPLNDILKEDDRYLLSGWSDKETPQFDGWGVHSDVNKFTYEEYQQWHIVAAPGHPFLKAVIENVLHNIDNYDPGLHGVGKLGVLKVTGPIAYTLAIAPLLHLHKHRFVHSKSDMGFEYSFFDTKYGHNALFKAHYSDLSDSIIKIEGAKKISVLIFKIFKKIKDVFTA